MQSTARRSGSSPSNRWTRRNSWLWKRCSRFTRTRSRATAAVLGFAIERCESAISAPSASFGGQYFHGDLFEMAATYMFHLIKNHAFVDGNKRVGVATALVFLGMNEIEVENEG